MDRLQAMTVFVAVAEEEGFAAAARRLGMSAPAVTRAVAALESRLGTPLLLRTTRHVRLTPAGQQYLLDARRILADIAQADESVAGLHGTPTGLLTVTAPAMFGRLYVMPVITDFLSRYEQVAVSAMFVDRVTHLVEEGIDVGIRIGELPDSNLRAIRLGSVKLKTYASPDYLKQFGEPNCPKDLPQHRLIVSLAGNRSPHWQFRQPDSAKPLRLSPQLRCTTNDAVIAAAVDHYGITRVLSYQAGPEVAAGTLQPILQDYDGDPIPVSIVHAQGSHVPARVRTFIDMAVTDLRALPVLNTQ